MTAQINPVQLGHVGTKWTPKTLLNSHPSWSHFHCVSSHFLSCHSGLNVIELAAVICLLKNVPVERVQLLKYEAEDSALFIELYSIVEKI